VSVKQVLAFASGWLALAAALLSPVDRLGNELFAMHMIQHEILMLIAAPLLVLGRPLVVFLWAFPKDARGSISRLTQTRGIARSWQAITHPLTGWTAHAVTLWAWHAPLLFNAVLTNRFVHDVQHFTFLAAALMFWSALLETRGRDQQGAAILYLFTTVVHSGVLGALITFASHPWYPHYLATAPNWGLRALEDQQLGGLIMWIPGSLVYIGFALLLIARWIASSEPGPLAGRREMLTMRPCRESNLQPPMP
jgi:putative membrane protein